MIQSITTHNFLVESYHQDFNSRISFASSVALDAAAIILGAFTTAFDYGKDNKILHSQSYNGIYPVKIYSKIAGIGSVFRELIGVNNSTTHKGARLLNQYGKNLMLKVRSFEQVNLPVIAYYNSKVNKRFRESNYHISTSRSVGYEDCFNPSFKFADVYEWLSLMRYAILQESDNERLKKLRDSVVSTANNVATTPLVYDLAWRCVKLNSHLDVRENTGVVMIDHKPSYLSSLVDYFPKMQFIMSE